KGSLRPVRKNLFKPCFIGAERLIPLPRLAKVLINNLKQLLLCVSPTQAPCGQAGGEVLSLLLCGEEFEEIAEQRALELLRIFQGSRVRFNGEDLLSQLFL